MAAIPPTIQERITLPPATRMRSAETGPALTPSDILAMLRRRAVMATFLFFVFAALAGGGLAVWWFKFPGFRSSCLIECITNIPETGLAFEQQDRLRQDEHERFVLSQALLLKSPNVLGETLKITAVRETDWYKSIKPEDRLIELSEELAAFPRRGTSYLEVSMECRKPKDATTIVNEAVAVWYRDVKKRSSDRFTSDLLASSQTEMEQLNGAIDAKRKKRRSIAERLPAGVSSDRQNSTSLQDVAQLKATANNLELEQALLDKYRTLYESPEGLAPTPEDRAAVEVDPQVSELSRHLFLLTQQRASAEGVYGRRHSFFKEIDAQIKATEERLDQLRTQKFNEQKADRRQLVNTAYMGTQQSNLFAKELLAKREAEVSDQSLLLAEYDDLDKEITDDLEYRLKLNEFIKSLQRVKDRQMAVDVNVAQPAVDPIERNSPDLRLMIPFGLFLALTLSVGIALALELFDKSVRTSQDIARHLDVAVLGAVPDIDDEEVTIEKVETALRDAPRSMIAEGLRRIRTGLQFSSPAEQQKTVLVTSASPSEGRTTVACNLAIAVAQGGRKVLLVDANFRRPRLQHVFPGVKPQGLSNILVGNASVTDCVTSTNIARLDVIGSGPIPPNPAELLGSEQCRAFLRDVASQYDQVIFDSAPVLLASDAVVLATAVDGCVLVVRAKENSRGTAKRAVAMLTGVGAHIFGAVLNAAQVTRGGYFREQLRTFYDYQLETDSK